MAASIATDSVTGKLMAFTADKAAWWDKLGTCIRGVQDASTVLQVANIGWEVGKKNVYTQGADGTLYKVDGYSAIVRLDTEQQLSIMKSTYEPNQNRALVDWTEALIEVGAEYESAGGLGKGERVWVLARIPKAEYSIGDNDQHQTYLLATSSHDGSLATTLLATDVRVVCQNTLTLALAGAGKECFRVKHTKNAVDKLEQAKRLMSATIQTTASLKEKMELLAQRRVTRETVTSIMDKLFPPVKDDAGIAAKTRRDTVVSAVLNNFASNDNDAFPEQAGSAYALLNAVTNYTDHSRATRVHAGNDQTVLQSRAVSSIWGSGAELKESALSVIEELSTGSPLMLAASRVGAPRTGSFLMDAIRNTQAS